MCAKLTAFTGILCVAASVVLILLGIHPMFAVFPLLIGTVSALAVLLTVRRVCRRIFGAVAYGGVAGAVVGAAVSILVLVLLTFVGWTDGGHGDIVYKALLSFGAIAGCLGGVFGATLGMRENVDPVA
jgi:hypothetical protein